MNTPTQGQSINNCKEFARASYEAAYRLGDKAGYERGRASLLEELRSDGVDHQPLLASINNLCLAWNEDWSGSHALHAKAINDAILDYGDRIAAVERERCAKLCEGLHGPLCEVAVECAEAIRGAKP